MRRNGMKWNERRTLMSVFVKVFGSD